MGWGQGIRASEVNQVLGETHMPSSPGQMASSESPITAHRLPHPSIRAALAVNSPGLGTLRGAVTPSQSTLSTSAATPVPSYGHI